MIGAIWVNGRFGWPFVLAVLVVTLSILAIDFAWRVVVVPFETLLISAAAIEVATAALLGGSYFLFRKRLSRKT